jgi:DNA helicase-2/ATP-dependent DNA helicase PcrA
VGRAHLDRFLDEAADFANEADEASLPAFLAFLAAAEDEENGLEAGEAVVEPERVQILTVHGAKGLEWDIVAVPGLVQSVFPADPKAIDWTRTRQELPIPLRGDRADLPALALHEATDRKQVRDLVTEHNEGLRQRHAREERRLAYVALTRARHVLVCSGYIWDTTQNPRVPSPFLSEVREHADTVDWFEPEPGATNPLTAQPRAAEWPLDPFGPYPGDRGPGRRAAVERGAALVRSARTRPSSATSGTAAQWRADIDRLLAERARLARGSVTDVELPAQLSVSQLVELGRDPDELARSLHRPMPRPPTPWARRGTAFHTWLEQRWQHQALLDVDELPGAADADADDPDSQDFDELRTAFEKSNWAHRTPVEIEVPFEMTVRGTVLRGRMDAVFSDPGTPGGWLVVDWKTGRRPAGAAAQAAAVQLAAYRLAWARLCSLPNDQLHLVRAAFHYVRTGDTVEPTSLLDADGLLRLIAG